MGITPYICGHYLIINQYLRYEKLLKTVLAAFVLQWASMRLRYAVRLAERAHRKSGERYYVMPDHRDRLIVMRRSGMRRLRRYGYMDSHVRMRDVMRECFYCTADRGGVSLPPEVVVAKREMYLRYVTREM